MVNSINNPFEQLNGVNTTKNSNEKKTGELGQDEFMTLMLAQMKHQDPMNPMENGDFIAQLAQFRTVTGIDQLNNSFNGFSQTMQSSQALQASSLVGREVLVPG
ncbi:MAG: flagellar hook assembly protein FlgD, partial [Gammaproteobacteria bacterium]|nr:flagellar hook assembly protein FlgD [Gammaproteobacteria bacterium]